MSRAIPCRLLLPKEAYIENMSHDGRGIAKIDGKVVFIEGALLSEKVIFQYTKKSKGYDEGYALEVLSHSPERVNPICPHFNQCGGCQLQHATHPFQLKIKQDQVLNLLHRIGKVTPKRVDLPIFQETAYYRYKARLSIKYDLKKDRMLIGFREKRRPGFIANMDVCPILHQTISDILPELKNLFKKMSHPEGLPQIELAAGDTVVSLILRHMFPLTENDINLLQSFEDKHHIVWFLQPDGPASVYPLNPEKNSLFLTYSLPSESIEFDFYPTDFTQINPSMNRRMVELALANLALDKEDIVLDLFCGLGNFSLPIAKYAKEVIGIEGSESMVERAKHNAKKNQFYNTSFYALNLEELSSLTILKNVNITKCLIDPPRAGAEMIVKQMHTLSPKRIVYVSCDPATFARDAAVLVHEKGYVLSSLIVMDMFVHTKHIETMAVFDKG